jgi:hypothetical protein
MRTHIPFAGIVMLSVCVLCVALAHAATIPPTIGLRLEETIAPSKLPKRDKTSIAVGLSGRISTSDGSLPPGMRFATLSFDEGVTMNPTAVPKCKASELLWRTVKVDGHPCQSSIVGAGAVNVAAEASDESGKVVPFTVFSAGGSSSKGALLIQLSDGSVGSAVSVAEVVGEQAGGNGRRLVFRLPVSQVVGGYGRVLGFNIRFYRKGKQSTRPGGLLLGECRTGHLAASLRVGFISGAVAVGSDVQSCLPAR